VPSDWGRRSGYLLAPAASECGGTGGTAAETRQDRKGTARRDRARRLRQPEAARYGPISPGQYPPILHGGGHPHHGPVFRSELYHPQRPANTDDCLLCDRLARNAAHAAMAGKTDVLVGMWYNTFIHVPISLAIEGKKRLCPESAVWRAVQAATGHPPRFCR